MKQYQHKTKPILPRVDMAEAVEDALGVRLDQMTPAQRAAVLEEFELKRDAEFLSLFTPGGILRGFEELDKELASAGWAIQSGDQEPSKGGVSLDSEEGYAMDRGLSAANTHWKKMAALMPVVGMASPQHLRNLREAYMAGMALAECRAYGLGSQGGRKTAAKRELDIAIANWKRANPNAERIPVAREILRGKHWPAATGSTPRPVPSERTISNLLSKHYPRRKR